MIPIEKFGIHPTALSSNTQDKTRVEVDDLRLGRVCLISDLLQQKGSRVLSQGVRAQIDTKSIMVYSCGGNVENIALSQCIST